MQRFRGKRERLMRKLLEVWSIAGLAVKLDPISVRITKFNDQVIAGFRHVAAAATLEEIRERHAGFTGEIDDRRLQNVTRAGIAVEPGCVRSRRFVVTHIIDGGVLDSGPVGTVKCRLVECVVE